MNLSNNDLSEESDYIVKMLKSKRKLVDLKINLCNTNMDSSVLDGIFTKMEDLIALKELEINLE